ncbi:MAG: DUF3006 family protein [Bradymonadales bacterium]|jgi:hypothetical protein
MYELIFLLSFVFPPTGEHAEQRIVVDRIIDDIAVIEANEEMYEIALYELPMEAYEGMVISLRGNPSFEEMLLERGRARIARMDHAKTHEALASSK